MDSPVARGYAAYVGWVGALAVALGMGAAIASASAVAYADTTGAAGASGWRARRVRRRQGPPRRRMRVPRAGSRRRVRRQAVPPCRVRPRQASTTAIGFLDVGWVGFPSGGHQGVASASGTAHITVSGLTTDMASVSPGGAWVPSSDSGSSSKDSSGSGDSNTAGSSGRHGWCWRVGFGGRQRIIGYLKVRFRHRCLGWIGARAASAWFCHFVGGHRRHRGRPGYGIAVGIISIDVGADFGCDPECGVERHREPSPVPLCTAAQRDGELDQ